MKVINVSELKGHLSIAEPVLGIVERLRMTGKLDLEGIVSKDQQPLFPENQ